MANQTFIIVLTKNVIGLYSKTGHSISAKLPSGESILVNDYKIGSMELQHATDATA
jgi:hypothetical protein